jgi:hypothetical protein
MSIDKAIKILTEYQSWRLGNIEKYPRESKEVTIALDKVLNCFKEPTLCDRAKAIIDYRKRMNYDQFSMSEMLGISQPKLSKIENAKAQVDDDMWHEFEMILKY